MSKKSRSKRISRLRNSLIVDGDSLLKQDLKPTDVVVLIIGDTGAGKSTFVNELLDKEVASVSGGLDPCSKYLKHYICNCEDDHHSSRRLIVVDTPGFNSNTTEMDSALLLARISLWLATQTKGMSFAGIIYLHDITQARVTTDRSICKSLLKESGSDWVVFGTTHWPASTTDSDPQRMERFKKLIVEDMKIPDPQIFKFEKTHASALDIVNFLILKYDESVESGHPIPERDLPKTSAAESSQDQLHKITEAIRKLINSDIPQRLKNFFRFLMTILEPFTRR